MVIGLIEDGADAAADVGEDVVDTVHQAGEDAYNTVTGGGGGGGSGGGGGGDILNGQDPWEAVVGAGEAVADVPADAANTTMGACEGGNCGWFGEVDRALDPRGDSEEDFADDSGIWAGVQAGRNATTRAVDEVTKTATDPILASLGFTSMTEEGQRQRAEQAQQRQQQQQAQQPQQPQQPSGGLGLSTGMLAVLAIGGAALVMGVGS